MPLRKTRSSTTSQAKPSEGTTNNDASPPSIFHEFGLDLWNTFHKQGFTTVAVIREFATDELLRDWKFPNLGALCRAKQLLQKIKTSDDVVTQARTPSVTVSPAKKTRRIIHCGYCHEVVDFSLEHQADAGFYFCAECVNPNCGSSKHRTVKQRKANNEIEQQQLKDLQEFTKAKPKEEHNTLMLAYLSKEKQNGFVPETSRDLSCLMTRAIHAVRIAEDELHLSNAVRRYVKDRIKPIRTTASKLAFAKEHFEEFVQLARAMTADPSLQQQNPELYARVRQPTRHNKKNKDLQQATRAQFENRLQELYMQLPPPLAPTVETTPSPSPSPLPLPLPQSSVP